MAYANDTWQRLDAWLKKPGVKTAAEEPSTSHPVGSAPDSTVAATEGARSSENVADVKKDVPVSAQAASDSINKGDSPAPLTPSAKPTGEDKSNETGMAKSTKDDPGTSHPAKAGTEKYANLISLGQTILGSLKTANAVVPAVVAEAPKAPATEVKKDEKKDEKKVEKTAEAQAFEAGQKVAEAAATAVQPAPDTELLAQIVKSAQADAERVVDYLAGFLKSAEEAEEAKAEGEAPAQEVAEQEKAPGAEGAAPEGVPPGAAGEAGQPEIEQLIQAILDSGVPVEELIAALQQAEGGQGAEGAGAPPQGMPPEAAMPPPEAMPQGMPPEAKMASAKKVEAVKVAAALLAQAKGILAKK